MLARLLRWRVPFVSFRFIIVVPAHAYETNTTII
jgi:hypothetical protein